MYTNEIVCTIRRIVSDVIGRDNFDNDDNLLSVEPQILPADYLYIFDLLEKEIKLSIGNIIACNSYDVLTVNRLAIEIQKILAVE